MASLRPEIDSDALVEVVDLDDPAEPPCLAEHERTGRPGLLRDEKDEFLKPDKRLVKRPCAEFHSVQKRKKKTILCRLLQCIPDTGSLDLLAKLLLVFANEAEGCLEVALLGAFAQLAHRRFRVNHLVSLFKVSGYYTIKFAIAWTKKERK